MCDINDDDNSSKDVEFIKCDDNEDNYYFCCYKLVSLRLLEITWKFHYLKGFF